MDDLTSLVAEFLDTFVARTSLRVSFRIDWIPSRGSEYSTRRIGLVFPETIVDGEILRWGVSVSLGHTGYDQLSKAELEQIGKDSISAAAKAFKRTMLIKFREFRNFDKLEPRIMNSVGLWLKDMEPHEGIIEGYDIHTPRPPGPYRWGAEAQD